MPRLYYHGTPFHVIEKCASLREMITHYHALRLRYDGPAAGTLD